MAISGDRISATESNQTAANQLAPSWQAEWDQPSAEMRPLQIVHGQLFRADLPGNDAGKVKTQIKSLESIGLGGIVGDVPFENYMQSAADWQLLKAGVEACRDLELRVWIYDEQGYPSGAAGGLVLQENPEWEATELAFDSSGSEPQFVVRHSYEFTHANNNYHASRRYINFLDAAATQSFIRHTHAAYWRHLQPFFGTTIRAFFTDEPSLLAVSLGQIPATARQRVRVVDPPDPNVKSVPAVPWQRELPALYKQRYHEDLVAQRISLFGGDSKDDRRIRRQFWMLISDLVQDRYFGALGTWCREHHVASSGHSLHEESVIHQVPLEGNALAVLGQMQIPGMDMLSSDPMAVTYSGWLTAALPSSAAILNGRRRCMTEVSDFQQKMGGAGPADTASMMATAAWQAAWGVTEFTLYYRPEDRSPDDYRSYCRFVGRVNALLKPADIDADMLLYYPIYDLMAEYRPVAEPLALKSQSARAQQIVLSFMQLGSALQHNQVAFSLVDFKHLAHATVDGVPTLRIANHAYRGIVIPSGVELPEDVQTVVDRFQQAGGIVVQDRTSDAQLRDAASVRKLLRPTISMVPASRNVVMRQYRRDGRRILILVNVAKQPYTGHLQGMQGEPWAQCDPQNGQVASLPRGVQGGSPIHLAPLQTQILVEPASVAGK